MDLKSRKLLGTVILFLTSLAMLYLSKATFPEWASFVQWIWGIYIVGNGVEHGANAYKAKK